MYLIAVKRLAEFRLQWLNSGLESHCPAYFTQMIQFGIQRTVHRWLLLKEDDSIFIKVDTTRVLECEFETWIVTTL